MYYVSFTHKNIMDLSLTKKETAQQPYLHILLVLLRI